MTNEVELIRNALRGRRLSVLATALGVKLPALEMFVSGRAGLAPSLLNGLARILETPNQNPAPPIKTIPAPGLRKPDMKLSARALKVSAGLDPSGLRDPGGASRVTLEIAVGGKTYSADIASKSIRKCRATIAEHGADCVLLIQGRLEGAAIVEAGLSLQIKTPRPAQDFNPATQENAKCT